MKKIIALIVIIACSLGIIAFGIVYLINEINYKNSDVYFNKLKQEKLQVTLHDITFLGDSITSGYDVYNKLPKTQAIYKSGLAASKMFTSKFVYTDDDVDLTDTLKKLQPKILYVAFGMNDLNDTPENFYKTYKENILKIMDICPDTKLAIVSITPINNQQFTNQAVDNFNNIIKKIVSEINSDRCKYFNVHDYLSDSNGKLKDDYNAGDGTHLCPYAYDKLLDYIADNPVY